MGCCARLCAFLHESGVRLVTAVLAVSMVVLGVSFGVNPLGASWAISLCIVLGSLCLLSGMVAFPNFNWDPKICQVIGMVGCYSGSIVTAYVAVPLSQCDSQPSAMEPASAPEEEVDGSLSPPPCGPGLTVQFVSAAIVVAAQLCLVLLLQNMSRPKKYETRGGDDVADDEDVFDDRRDDD